MLGERGRWRTDENQLGVDRGEKCWGRRRAAAAARGGGGGGEAGGSNFLVFLGFRFADFQESSR